MSLPLLLSKSLPALPFGSPTDIALRILLGIATSGLIIQVLGDTHKSVAKARGEGLVTTGLYSFLRHPNYTGETILWVASAAVGLVSGLRTSAINDVTMMSLCVGSVLGAIGAN